MSAPKLSRALRAVADAWPTDPFRPNLQFSAFLRSLADHPNLTPQAVRAAVILKENGIQNKYRLSMKMLQPASRPHYYDRLVEAFEKSAKGIERPFWKRFLGIW